MGRATAWDAAQYLKFEDQRTRPARDLLARVPLASAARIFDLGCGPGNSTALLWERYPEAEITGVDSSPDMLRQARERLPDIDFEDADLAAWTPPDDVDLLFANATFQWVPDHLSVLARLLEALPDGGVLAVQMPDNMAEPSHRLMREVAAEGEWADDLAAARVSRDLLPPVGTYYDRLRPLCSSLDLWHTAYQHPLPGAEAILEWVKGTGLRPFIDPLPAGQREAFLTAYLGRLAAAYPPQADGLSLLRFPRLFLVAVR
ncbi:MAG TPA: trans-aconitate 2-methyltransferase [Xanthobacteraceae bacterium]|nr:trans-aconitate 2-methyltransferase [Xanthobacteraceae bacterium]